MDPTGLSTGLAQVYLVFEGTIPSVLFTGAILNAVPLHTVCACAAVIVGCGFTSTDTVNAAPGQAPASPEIGDTVYVTVCGMLLVLTSVWLILLLPNVTFDSPVTFALSTTVQV